MADPVTIAALGAAAVGGGLQAAGSIMAGRERSMASKFEAQQLDLQARQYRTAAAQAETVRREELSSTLQTAMALRTGRGVGEGSPTALAIYENEIEGATRDIRTERLNFLMAADTSRKSAVLSRRRAKTSLIAGYVGAGEALTSAAYKGASALK